MLSQSSDDDPLVSVEMTSRANVRLSLVKYGDGVSDVRLELELAPQAARRVAILLLEEAERADYLFEQR